jgi:hypothetical protein
MFLIIHRAPSEVQLKNIMGRLTNIFPQYIEQTENIIEDSSNITTLKFSL